MKPTKKETNMDKFAWGPGVSAPRLYPSSVVYGYMFYGKDRALALHTGVLENCFGNSSVSIALNDDGRYELPTGVDVSWLSYVEKTMYKASFDLPVDTILHLFKEGYYDEKKKAHFTYNAVVLGFIPGGRILISLSGRGRRVTLNRIYQGEETTMPIEEIVPHTSHKTIKEFLEKILSFSDNKQVVDNFDKNGLSLNLWNRYLERFPYDIHFEFENKETIWNDAMLGFSSSDYYLTYQDHTPDQKAKPKRFITDWFVGDSLFSSYFYFNEKEVLDCFDKAYPKEKQQKGELLIKVSKYNNLFDISLKVGEKQIRLEETQIRTFKQHKKQEDTEAELIYKNYEGDHVDFIGE